MSKIDLLQLATEVEYEEVDLVGIGKVKVYSIPEPIIWRYNPDRSAPVKPTVAMKTVTGTTQQRPIKATDDGYEDWLKDDQDYEQELEDIRLAARYVLSLKDIEYPDLSNPPPNEAPNFKYPKSEILRKKCWLDHTLLAKGVNLTLIQGAMMKLSSGSLLDEDTIDNIKKNSELSIKEDQ